MVYLHIIYVLLVMDATHMPLEIPIILVRPPIFGADIFGYIILIHGRCTCPPQLWVHHIIHEPSVPQQVDHIVDKMMNWALREPYLTYGYIISPPA
jgi:hypothetical protein